MEKYIHLLQKQLSTNIKLNIELEQHDPPPKTGMQTNGTKPKTQT